LMFEIKRWKYQSHEENKSYIIMMKTIQRKLYCMECSLPFGSNEYF